jgi:hypothetical protein
LRRLAGFALLAVLAGSAASQPGSQRGAWLAQGEAALRCLDAMPAIAAFEQAVTLQHDAGAEAGLVRAYMQAGQYRSALVHAAHIAGVHRDEPAAAALYAWLLHLGGQQKAATQILDAARTRTPSHPTLTAVARLISSPLPIPGEDLLQPPWRFAPYAAIPDAPALRMVGSGTLIDSTTVVAPFSMVQAQMHLWARDSLGRIAKAVVKEQRAEAGIVILQVERPLGADASVWAPRDPFPGSAAYAVGVLPGTVAPGWPMLRVGFLRQPQRRGVYEAGLSMPAGMHGGPLLDSAGRLTGVVVPVGGSGTRVVLRSIIGVPATADTSTASIAQPLSVEEIYERAMGSVVQLLEAVGPDS